jgi:hypothetical protein
VNVMLGREPWDVRPLLLSEGKVSIARFSMARPEAEVRSLAADLEGFIVLSRSPQTIQGLVAEGRCMMLRPFEASTLSEDLERGSLVGREALADVVRQLIRMVADLSRRSVAHGHISPSNLALRGGELVLLDPLIGFMHRTADAFLPPESEVGRLPEPSADLYGLGRIIKVLLGDSLTSRQTALVEQLLLPSARQRPPLVEVAVAFGVQGISAPIESDSVQKGAAAGRLVRPGASGREDFRRQGVEPSVETPEILEQPRQSGTLGSWIVGGLVVAALGMVFLKSKRPELYYDIASYVPLLASEHSAEYDSDWASRERPRMTLVARAAVTRREPAAIQTITSDILDGANPEYVRASFLRVALSPTWRDDLTKQDAAAALAMSVQALVPDGVGDLPPLGALHPGIVLAIAGSREPLQQTAQLTKYSVDGLSKLPEPFGALFLQLKGMGVTNAGDPRALGLARIVTGDVSGNAFEAFLGGDTPAPQVLAKLATIIPVVAANPAGVEELVGVLRDRGGDIATLLAWFEISDLAHWSSFPAIDKLRLLLNLPTEAPLGAAQWSDLLSFPIEGPRSQAVIALKQRIPGTSGERLLLTLASPGLGLTREQIVALVSALALPQASQQPFVTAWFELKPAPNAVLLILLARSAADSADAFNLDAARYLRRTTWKAPLDSLALLADHPEPLARVLAYGRLDPTKGDERAVLTRREKKESDPVCLKVLRDRLVAR